METNQLAYVLEGLRFSAELPHDVLEQLAAESQMLEVPAGQIVFREGSVNNNL